LLSSFNDAAIVSSIRLEGGQDLSLSITRRKIDANGGGELLVKFGYRETAPRRAARLWWHRQKLQPDPNSRSVWSGARIYILAGGALVILLTSYLAYVMLRSRQMSGPMQTSVAQAIPPGPTPVAQAIDPPITNKPTPKKRPLKKPDEDAGDAVRSSDAVPNLKLSEVKKIYIEIRGDASLDELRERLNSSGIVTATTSVDEADAALKIVVSQNSTSAQLVNARGTVLWRGRSTVASDIVKDLLSQIRKR
jgi:hypothetical protein